MLFAIGLMAADDKSDIEQLAWLAGCWEGQTGPVRIEDANYEVRWVAAVLAGGVGCSFSADLVPGSGTAVHAISATVGTAPAPGSLYGDFFAAHPELVGVDLFLRVASDCSWALSIVRSVPISG